MDTRQDVGITACVAGFLALLTVILIGIEPALPAPDPASTLLAMSLFKQDPPPPVAKPKVGLPKSPDPIVRAGAPNPPAIGIQPPTPGPNTNTAAHNARGCLKAHCPYNSGRRPVGARGCSGCTGGGSSPRNPGRRPVGARVCSGRAVHRWRPFPP